MFDFRPVGSTKFEAKRNVEPFVLRDSNKRQVKDLSFLFQIIQVLTLNKGTFMAFA
jgi:hypothetical protein